MSKNLIKYVFIFGFSFLGIFNNCVANSIIFNDNNELSNAVSIDNHHLEPESIHITFKSTIDDDIKLWSLENLEEEECSEDEDSRKPLDNHFFKENFGNVLINQMFNNLLLQHPKWSKIACKNVIEGYYILYGVFRI